MPKWTTSHGRRSSSNQKCLPWRRTARTRRPTSARRIRAGGTRSKTIGSSATVTEAIRRPAVTAAAARRAVSTSGSSGMASLPPRHEAAVHSGAVRQKTASAATATTTRPIAAE
jgi:hypothetical protein